MSDTKKSALQILRDAKALIEKGWTQGSNARNELGDFVRYNNPMAVCWCINGAVLAAGDDADTWTLDEVVGAVRTEISKIDPRCGEFTHRWNDESGRTKEEVLALLDRVIAQAEAPRG